MTNSDRATLIEQKLKRLKWLHDQTAAYINEAEREQRELELLQDPANDNDYLTIEEDGFPF